MLYNGDTATRGHERQKRTPKATQSGSALPRRLADPGVAGVLFPGLAALPLAPAPEPARWRAGAVGVGGTPKPGPAPEPEPSTMVDEATAEPGWIRSKTLSSSVTRCFNLWGWLGEEGGDMVVW